MMRAVADKTVSFRPGSRGRTYSITGSASDTGVLGAIERDQGMYEDGICRLLERVLRPGAVAIDIGANIGVLTVLMADLCGPTGAVHAFEPAGENFNYLMKNVAASGATNVTASRAAVTAGDGPVTIEFNEAYPAGSFVDQGASASPSASVSASAEKVDGVALDSYVERAGLERIDLIKIDVEGFEPAVLHGAKATLARFRPMLIVECNVPPLRRLSGASYVDLLGLMRAAYDTVAIVEPTGATVPLRGVDDLELALAHHGVVDLVGVPDGHTGLGLRTRRARSRALAARARLRREHNDKRPPARNFLLGEHISFEPAVDEMSGFTGEVQQVSVTVVNRSRWWLSSDFVYEPINLSYHWLRSDGSAAVFDGHRTKFATPLGPGRATKMDMTVELPPAPGNYTLAITVVQEAFGWGDQINPACVRHLPATASSPA
jgi:FkbM family methyltransferase